MNGSGHMRKQLIVVAMSVGAFVADANANIPRRFIAHGWDTMKATPENVLSNAAKFASVGTDGVTLVLPERDQADGTHAWPTIHLPTDPAYLYETYADQVPILREISDKLGLRESFLMCSFTPMRGRMGFGDDAKWERFAHNLRVFARIAHEGGLRGLVLDNEDYCARNQFTLAPEDGAFGTAYTLARRRGRQVFEGVFSEFPEAVILPFWLLSQVQSLATGSDPVAAMRNAGSLWPAFVNGILDVLSPTAVLVDGNEFAYTYEWNNGSFAASAADQLVGFLPLVAPENRAKYRSQLRVGFGLYLDMYVNEDPNGPWYSAPVNGSRLEHLRLNVTEAAKRADEYVWLYGEKVSFVRWEGLENGNSKFATDVTWEDRLPGLARTLGDVKNPGAGLMERILAARKKGTAANVFPLALAKETHWANQNYKPAGTYEIDPDAGVGGTITIRGVRNGCCNLPFAAKPGEVYVADMWMAGSCGDREHPTLCFMDDAGKYRWDLGTVHASLVEKDSVGRSRFCALVHVPENMKGVNLMLNGSQQNGEVASFTDIFIARSDE